VRSDDRGPRSSPSAPFERDLPRELEIRDALAEIGRIISASLQLEDVYFQFARQVSRLLPYDRLSLASIDRGAWTYRFEYIVGEQTEAWPVGESFALDGTTKERAITIASPVRISTRDLETVAAPSVDIPGLIDVGLESMLVVPLQWRQYAVGLLTLCSKDPGAYEREEIEIAERVGTQISGAVANIKLREDLQRELAVAETLTELGQVISSSTNFGEVFQQFASAVRRLIPHDRLAFGSLDPLRGCFTGLLAAGVEVPGYSFEETEPFGPGVAAALQRRASIAMSAGGTYPEFEVHRYEDPGTHAGLKSTLLVPLIAGNRAVGVLWFRSEEPDRYGIQHRNLATRIGRLIAGHVANADAYQVLASEVLQRTALEGIGRVSAEAASIAELAEGWLDRLARSLPTRHVQLTVLDSENRIVTAAYRCEAEDGSFVRGAAARGLPPIDASELEGLHEAVLVRRRGGGFEKPTGPSTGGEAINGSSLHVAFPVTEAATGLVTFSREDGLGYTEDQYELARRAAPLIASGFQRVTLINRLSLLVELQRVSRQLRPATLDDRGRADLSKGFASAVRSVLGAECVVVVDVAERHGEPQIAAHDCLLGSSDCATWNIARSFIADTPMASPQVTGYAHVVEVPNRTLTVPGSTVAVVTPMLRDGSAQGVLAARIRVDNPAVWNAPAAMGDATEFLTSLRATYARIAGLMRAAPRLPTPVLAVLIHEHRSCRESLKSLFEHSRVHIVGEGLEGTAGEVVERCEPAVVIYRIHAEGTEDFQWLSDLRARGVFVPVLVIGDSPDSSAARRAVHAGAAGFVSAGLGPDLMSCTVEDVARGGGVVDRELLAEMVGGDTESDTTLAAREYARSNGLNLSHRDLDILIGVAQGESNSEVASRLHLATGTVKNRLVRLYRLLGVSHRAEVIYLLGRMRQVERADLPRSNRPTGTRI